MTAPKMTPERAAQEDRAGQRVAQAAEEARGTSEFTAWLRERGLGRLCEGQDSANPLSSRVAALRKRGGTDAEIRELLTVWKVWREG